MALWKRGMADTIEIYQAHVVAGICCTSDYTDFRPDDNTFEFGS